MALTHIETSSGFASDIDENALDDMELLDGLLAIETGDATAYAGVVKKLLKPEDKIRLYDTLRTEDGRVPITEFGKAIAEIVQGLKLKKK